MKKIWLFTVLLLLTISAFAQTRDDINIYIPAVVAADPTQAGFFKENFEMETTAAGYTLTDSSRDADYTLKLEVKPNMILYDDGTEEPAPPEEGQFLLQINLIRNEDDVEVVAFSFPFSDVNDMYQYNLYLLYEAMANVPLTKLTGSLEVDDRWRNKWVYIRTSFDYGIPFYQITDADSAFLIPNDLHEHPDPIANETLKVNPRPAATIGLEIHYFNWMSTEVNFQFRFGDPFSSNVFIPSMQIQQKFPIKPAKHFMIEPFVTAAFSMNTSDKADVPVLGVGGGVQFGVQGGNMGAFFVDANFVYALGEVKVVNDNVDYSNPTHIVYSRHFFISIGLGYKVGFIDRPKR